MSSPIIATLPHESERLRLRLLRVSDLTDFHTYRSNPEVARLQGWSSMSREKAESFIQEHAAVRTLKPGSWSQIGVARKDDDLLVGDVGLWLSPDGSGAEFGLTIAPAFQGQGLGSETAAGAIALLFRDPAIKSIVAITDVRNVPCLAALRSAGMELVKSQEVVYKGEVCREQVFSIGRFEA